MYESTIHVDILKDGSQKPLNFLDTASLLETTTITGTVSGTITINGMWVNNTLEDRIVSTIDIIAETQELTEYWVNLIQEKAELGGFTMYISINEEQ